MLSSLHQAIDHDTMGRIIAYGGGGGVWTFSQFVEQVHSTPVADWALWISAVAVLGRLVFDVYKYFDGKRKK